MDIKYIKPDTYAAFALPANTYDAVAAVLRAREYHHVFDTENGAIIMDGIAFTRTPAPNAHVSDQLHRAWWRSIGGRFYGPNVETATIPEARLFEVLSASAWPVVSETAWLIENGKPGADTLYYRMSPTIGWGWTPNVDEALRFARCADATALFGVHNHNGWVAREHQWG